MRVLQFIAILGAAACAHGAARPEGSVAPMGAAHPGEPAAPPSQLLGLLGEYDTPLGMRVVLEDSGRLFFADTVRHRVALRATSNDAYAIAPAESQSILGQERE